MTNVGSVAVTVRTFAFLVVSSAALVVRWMVFASSSLSSSSSPVLGGGCCWWWWAPGAGGGNGRQEIVPPWYDDDQIHNTIKRAAAAAEEEAEEAAETGGSTVAARSSKKNNASPSSFSSSSSSLLLSEEDENDHAPGIGITVLCHMSGEMGNHLDIYAHCYALKRILEDRYYYYHHQVGDGNHDSNEETKKEVPLTLGREGVAVVARRGYADSALHDLPKCFPHFRTVDFDEGIQSKYDAALVWQQKQLRNWEGRAMKKKKNSTSEDVADTDDGENAVKLGDFQLVHNAFVTMSTRHEPDTVLAELDAFVDRLRKSAAASASALSTSSSAPRSHSSLHAGVSDVSDPSINPMSILYAQWLFSVDAFVDTYMDELREMYEFMDNSTDCCRAVPHPDETVFHLRNFVVEMPNRGKELGFQELSPVQTARDLFGHLPTGSRVAILSRFGVEHVQPYVDAMTGIGLHVRVVEGQSGLQDFCFLRRAQFGMVGMAISTYFMWAAMLGDCPVVTAYSVDTAERRQMFGDGHVTYNFTHPLLRGRFAFPLIEPDDETTQATDLT